MTTRITVLMPVRNGGHYLAGAISSIVNQSLCELELLIIDDHSDDGALDDVCAIDSRIRVASNTGRGIVDALNCGIHMARGEWIARMDADDIASLDRLQCQLQFATDNPSIGLIGAQVSIFRQSVDGQSTPAEGYRLYEQWINQLLAPEQIEREIFIESPIPHPTAFCRTKTLKEIGGYRDMGWPEDYDLWLRLSQAGVAMAKPEGILLHWRDHDERLSRNSEHCSANQFLRLKANFLAARFKEHAQTTLWGAGPSGKRLFDHLKLAGVEVSQFIDVHPRRIGGTARGRPVRSVDAVADIHEPIIVAVGSRGARKLIRAQMHRLGRIEGDSFVFAM